MRHGDSSWPGAFFNTSGTKPAFFRIEDNGGFFLFWIRHHNIGRTHLYAKVATVAYGWIELLPFIGGWRIRRHVYFVIHFRSPFLVIPHEEFVTRERRKLTTTILPLDGDDYGGGGQVMFPLTPALSPAFAEAASRRQAPWEKG
jgi:hypothetical protein